MIRFCASFSAFRSCGIVGSDFNQILVRSFRPSHDGEINLNDRETLKQYVGVRAHLSSEPVTKVALKNAMFQVLSALQAVPVSSEYRKALEATCDYRLKVLEANESEAAVEEVLDAHLEELVHETVSDLKLIDLFKEKKPWDVADNYTVPVVEYHNAAEVLQARK